jgi:beta-1,4-mannosyltransferase
MMDWHNLGFAMFEQKLGSRHPLVGIAKVLEQLTGRLLVDDNLCVSNAMREWLKKTFVVNATTLYDRPANIFSKEKPSLSARHELLHSLGFTDKNLFPDLTRSLAEDVEVDRSTAQTTAPIGCQSQSALPLLRLDRARLVVSSTSWTDDEDFMLLLNALLLLDQSLKKLDQQQSSSPKGAKVAYAPPRVIVVITGKGTLRALFEEEVKKHETAGRLTRVAVRTAWLSAVDYPLLLACADLGVCLHSSTSGLDLPMKVLDMFGSGLPVCALDFPTIPELVKQDHNGLIFKTSEELSQQMMRLLFPATGDNLLGFDFNELETLRKGAQDITSWNENWTAVAAPQIKRIIARRKRSSVICVTAARKVFVCLLCLVTANITGIVLYMRR